VRIVVAPFFTTGATLVLISRLVGTNAVRDDLVAGFVGDRRRGERGRGAPQRERQVVGGEMPHVERASGTSLIRLTEASTPPDALAKSASFFSSSEKEN
jgi:hypothetical protein